MAEDQGTEEFIVALSGVGIDIKRAITPEKAAVIMNVIMGVESIVGENDLGASRPTRAAGAAKTSLREFLDDVKAMKKPDQVVAIGHYIGMYEGHATFTRDNIKARFAAAREPMPSNFPRDFATAIKAGMIAEDHKQAGHYYVTKTGIHAVERRFGSQNRN